MTAVGERIGRSTTKAFATPWVVCRNVAYPPQKLKTPIYRKEKGNGREGRVCCPFAFSDF